MKLIELKNRINTNFKGHGHYMITIEYRNKKYKCTTTNMMAIDRIGNEQKTHGEFYGTEKEALLCLWNECKRKNDLK